ncbi:MAG TPA: PilZ domain-containing protein [Afipia sp.]
MSERRRFSRIRINRPATFSFEGRRGRPACLVQDITGEGAKLALDGVKVFPLQFDLHFEALSIGRKCDVVWSSGYTVGVKFQSSFKLRRSFN